MPANRIEEVADKSRLGFGRQCSIVLFWGGPPPPFFLARKIVLK